MVPLKGSWTPFKDKEDQINHYRQWGLIPPTSKTLRPVMVVDGYFDAPEPCTVVGYQGDNWAVIEMADGLHGIYGEYLAELQPVAHQKLPRGVCFAEILSKYIVLDIETTGLSYQHDRVIEIAAVLYEYGNKISEFHSVVNPGMLLPANIVALTGITQEEVNQAPYLEEIERDFFDFISDHPIIGHNVLTFDIPFLSAHLSHKIDNDKVDTLYIARKAFDLLPRHKLDYLKAVLQIGNEVSHRAMSDVETTNALLWACLAPRKYEHLVKKAYLDEKLSPKSEKKEKKSIHTTSSIAKPKSTVIKSIPPKYVVFDIETTGFAKGQDRIIEIAAIRYESGVKVATFHTLVNPVIDIPSVVVKLTGITQSDVQSAPPWEDVRNDFIAFIRDYPLVGHNALSFDVPFVSACLASPITNQVIDTLTMSRKEFPELDNHKLEFLKDALNLGDVESHRALADCEITNNLLLKCITHLETSTFNLLLPTLKSCLLANNAGEDNIRIDLGMQYSSVSYLKPDPYDPNKPKTEQLAFRICCRGKKQYFGISKTYDKCIPSDLRGKGTETNDGYINFNFDATEHSVMAYAPMLVYVLEEVTYSSVKEFDCCSRFEQCSNARKCIHPNPAMATSCGYRKIMKPGRIYYTEARQISTTSEVCTDVAVIPAPELNLSENEKEFVQKISTILSESPNFTHLKIVERSSNYLSIVLSQNDFLRFKISSRSKWISLRLPVNVRSENQNNPIFAAQKNKAQFHWKAELSTLDDLDKLKGFILLSCTE